MYLKPSHYSLPKRVFLLNTVTACVLVCNQSHAMAPDAGTIITNQAFASITHPDTKTPLRIKSNTITVKVGVKYAIDLSQVAEQYVEPGDSVTWLNVLTNTGNTPVTVDVSSVIPKGLIDLTLYRDINKNGKKDANDIKITKPIALAREENAPILVVGTTKSTLADQENVSVTLDAVIVENQRVKKRAVDSLVAIKPQLNVEKTVNTGVIDPDKQNAQESLTYRLTAKNPTKNRVKPVDIIVDGKPMQAVLLTDNLPANTTFVSATPVNKDALVLFPAGADRTYTQVVPEADRINTVVIAYPQSIAANTTEVAEIIVSLNAGTTNTNIVNRFDASYLAAGKLTVSKISEPAKTEIKGKPQIGYTNADFSLKATETIAGDPLFLDVNAAQCNLSRQTPDQVWLTLRSEKTQDVVRALATETGNNTGRFRLNTPTDETTQSNTTDAVLQTVDGDTIRAELNNCVKNNKPTAAILDVFSTILVRTLPVPELSVQKTVNTPVAEIGDFIDYTITVTNTGNAAATQLAIKDKLPLGFKYVDNTAYLNQTQRKQPQFAKNYMTLGLNDLKPKEKAVVSYRVYIGTTAVSGDGINRVIAEAKDSRDRTVSSLEASAAVRLRKGILSPNGFIVGKVYTDCNRDGIQNNGEQGVPGVRLYLENGSFVVTDRQGKYDFYGVSAKTHVLKLDRTTLPRDVELIEQHNRQAGDPSSQFVDMRNSGMHRADFAMTDNLDTCTTDLVKAVDQRKQRIAEENHQLERAIRSDLAFDPQYNVSNVKGLKPTGCVSIDGKETDCEHAIVTQKQPTRRTVPVNTVQPIRIEKLEDTLQRETNTLDIINLTDGQVLPYPQATIQVKAIAGAKVKLYVNDTLVPESQIGKRAVFKEKQSAGYDYIGVNLSTGENRVTVKQFDTMGNARGEKSITLIAPDTLNALTLKTHEKYVVADGVQTLHVTVALTDANGVAVSSRTPITIDSDIGKIKLTDLDPKKNGVQVFVEGGELAIPILSPTHPGEGTLQVNSGVFESSVPLKFTPELRPMIATGIIEGVVSLRDLKKNGLRKADADDGFEEELQTLAEGNDGKLKTTGRAAFFLKGKVKGEYLLTLSYDSDKSRKERLFRDIRPDEYYPVYGDAAAKGFDAQSTSKLYVRVDKGRSYVLYGDMTTQIENESGLSLGQYNRTLTGAKAKVEHGDLTVHAFAARTNSTQVSSEQAGQGISGPYSLGDIPFDSVIANSEKIDVIVRSRDNSGLIISRKTLSRFRDYEIDTLSNSVFLKSPIPSQDEQGNPVSLRITVESEGSGPTYDVGGIAAAVDLSKALRLGAAYAQSDDPLKTEKVSSLYAVAKPSKHTKVVAEIASSENSIDSLSTSKNDLSESTVSQQGTAGRIEVTYDNKKLKTHLYANKAEDGFNKTSSPVAAGKTEAGFKIQRNFNRIGNVNIEGVHSNDNTTTREGVTASVQRSIGAYVSAEVGVRSYKETTKAPTQTTAPANNTATQDTDQTSGTSVRAKLSAQVPHVKAASAFVEYEQDVKYSDRNAFAVGADYQLNNGGKLYARHELFSSLRSLYGLNGNTQTNTTVVGIKSNYMKGGDAYSEYRVKDRFSGREAEAAIGLKNEWHLKYGIRLHTSFEKVQALENTAKTKDSTAASVAIEYLPKPDWKAVGKLEKRWAENQNTTSHTLGVAYKLSDDITLLTKNNFNKLEYKTKGNRVLDRFQLGVAYRDNDSNRFDMLTKLEYRLDNDKSLDLPLKQEAYIATGHANYHPIRSLTLSGNYGIKRAKQTANNLTSMGTAQLLGGRVTYDINERWDVGTQLGTMWGSVGKDARYLAGVEAGYLAMANLWVSAGYNFLGYKDEHLANSQATDQGTYFRLRFKFDEDLFKKSNHEKDSSSMPSNVFGSVPAEKN